MREKQNQKPISCYCLKTRRASAVVTKFYDNMLESCGVTVRQYSLLVNIYRAKCCSVKELADMAELDRSTLARSLKPLYQQGLVIDSKEPGARNSKLGLSKAGKETVYSANQLWANAQKAVELKLGDDGLHSFEKLMDLLEAL